MTINIEDFRVDPADFQKDDSRSAIMSGYGSVTFQIQLSTKTKCAVKRTNDTLLDVDMKRSFTREIETLAQCQHPAIVPFVGFSEKNNFGYIYLVEMSNGSLQSFLDKCRKGKRDPNFDNTTKFIISYGVAKSMEYLHSGNRIHRDLKPGNVLLDEHLHPFLTDFGTAKKIDKSIPINQTLSSTTPTIMAPEFIEDPPTYSNSPCIDVYSYGITLYELWTEIPPFIDLRGCFQIFNAVTKGKRPKISDSVPEKWKELIEQCWSQSPDERPTFSDLVEKLETDEYITSDMNKTEIKKYKNFISDSSFNKSWVVSGVRVTDKKSKYEDSQDMENPVLTKIRQEAESGDLPSQFNYIVAQFKGLYGNPNYKEALKFAIPYANRQGATSKENLADTATIEYYAGRCYSLFEDYTAAQNILRRAVNHGNSDAAFFLAELIFDGKVESKRASELEMFYVRAADNGVPAAIKKYAYMTYFGTFNNRPDKKKAIQYFKKGSDNGDPELMYMWAIRNEFGRDIPKNTKEAMRLMKLAADSGYTPAMVDYAIHLLNGFNVDVNVDEARVRFETAAVKDDPWGQLWHSLMLKQDGDEENATLFLTKSLNSNEVPEAWAVYGRQLYEQGDIQNALSPLYYAAQNGSVDAYLCLGEICEANPAMGDSKFYYEQASYFCHCLDTFGFFTPVEYKVFHCIDCEIDICEGCANHCHADHNTTFSYGKAGFKCMCGKDGFKGKCSGEFVGETTGYQHLYQCMTCCMKSDTEYICKSCAEECHKGHQVTDCGILRDFCSCGMHNLPHNFNCHLLKYEVMKKPFANCSCDNQRQRWLQCISCGLYGSKEIGICKACASTCHKDHTVLDLGVKEGTCSCKNANCLFQDD